MSSPVAPRSVPPLDDAWGWAVRVLESWQEHDRRIDWSLDDLPPAMPAGVRARVQLLALGTLRHLGRINAAMDPCIKRPPRPWVRAALRVTAFEVLNEPTEETAAKAGHHLVERVRREASMGEARFANAIIRQVATALLTPREVPGEGTAVEDWANYYSHPAWLVERWRVQLGAADTRRFLETNQRPGQVTVRWRGGETPEPVPSWLEPIADVDGFYAVPAGRWPDVRPLLETGRAQVQDPATRHAISLLDPQVGETLLDLCASPGGKSLAMADRLQRGAIISVDLPGRRQGRLQKNLSLFPSGVTGRAVAADVCRGLRRSLTAANQPVAYSGVLIDVPCSNTGVMRHRVDVRWRLEPDSFRRHARQQLDLLQAAADCVAVDGRLVYSTCSIDREENEQLVQAFLRRRKGEFELTASELSRPWETGHDGAAAFRLERKSN